MAATHYLAIPLYVASIAVEAALLARAGRPIEPRDAATSLAMGAGSVVIGSAVALVRLPFFDWVYAHRLVDLPVGWWLWPVAMVADDFVYYWFHRCSHEVRLMWASHVNHHSSERYNLTTALRQSWTGWVVGTLFWAPLMLLGVPPWIATTVYGFNLIYQFWIHTELIDRLGWFEAVFNTPSHHRVHHGSNPRYLDRNYAGILIVWDRLFGTFEPETEPVVYGLTKNIHTFSLPTVAFHEWIAMARDVARARTWRDAAGAVFGPPAP